MTNKMQVLSEAWHELLNEYTHHKLPGQRDGFPARLWWSERDIVVRVAAWCAARIGRDSVHMEVGGFHGARSVDLYILHGLAAR